MSVWSPRTRIILVGIWSYKMAGREQKIWWNMFILTNQLDFLITYIWEALNQRACKSNQIIIDQHREMFESRLLVGATEKLPGWEKPACSKSVETLWTGQQKDRAVLQSLWSLLRWSHFKKEEVESDWEVSKVCSEIVLKCWNLPRTGRPDILCSVNQLAVEQLRKMFESRISAGATEKLPGWEKSIKHKQQRGFTTWDACSEMHWTMPWTSKQESKAIVQSFKSWFGWSSIQAGGTRISWRIVRSSLFNCLEMLVLGTNWATCFFVFGQQACEICHFLDSGMRTDDRQHWFHTFITQVITGSMVLWETRLSIVDWVYSKPQTLPWRFEIDLGRILCICRKLNIRLHQLDVQATNVRIPQFYRIGYHFVGCLVANGWTTCSWVMGCGDRSVTFIEQYQIANQSSSRKLFEESHIQTQTKGKICWLIVACGLTINPTSSQGESQFYIFEDNYSVIKMIIKGRSPTMRHESRTHRVAEDWLLDTITSEAKIPNQIWWHQKPTRRHVKQRMFHPWWVEPSLSLVEYHECLDFFLQPFQQFSLRSDRKSRVPCQREAKKRLPVKVHEWRNQNLWYRRRGDHSTWYHAARGVRTTLHRILGIWSILGMPMKRKGVEIASGNSLHNAAKSEVGYAQVSRQENAQTAEGNLCMQQLQKQRDQRATSDSNNSGQKSAGCDSDTGVSKHEIHEPSIHDQELPVLTKVGNFSRLLNFLTGSIQNTCVDMGVFSCLRQWQQTEFFGEPGGLQEHELRRNSELTVRQATVTRTSFLYSESISDYTYTAAPWNT